MSFVFNDARTQQLSFFDSYNTLTDRSLGRFRERCRIYEEETGIDLLKPVIVSLSKELAEMMKLDFSLRRMDSLMVASNIKKMSRLELLYTCVANLAKEMGKNRIKQPEQLCHYTQVDDRNRVIYLFNYQGALSKKETSDLSFCRSNHVLFTNSKRFTQGCK